MSYLPAAAAAAAAEISVFVQIKQLCGRAVVVQGKTDLD
jgi:hypothetical protein